MDNFMDKLAQRLTAQEIIKANSQAEAQEAGKIKEQVAVYDECLKEMRRVNLKNEEALEHMNELTDQIRQLTEGALSKIDQVQEKDKEEFSQAMEKTLEEIKEILAKEKETKEEAAREEEKAASARMEDFVHKECVKVYRNVQAVVVDETKKHAEEIRGDLKDKGNKGQTMCFVILILLMLANLGVQLGNLLGLF